MPKRKGPKRKPRRLHHVKKSISLPPDVERAGRLRMRAVKAATFSAYVDRLIRLDAGRGRRGAA